MTVLAKEIEATYEVLAKMGEGGMGAVYKVRHRFFDEIRVIKVMQAQLEPVDELKERFLDEAKRGKQLRHPNLAEVLDFSIAADGTSYIVMEYIEGVNLRDVLARNGGPLDYRTVVPIAEQILDALGFMHSKKFVHRDLSPDNMMLTNYGGPNPRVKLIDLGIAKSLESNRHLTMTGRFIGKVKYASPEQFTGQVDGRSDLYSLGVVLYELLTGEKPIIGKNELSIISGHMSRPPRSFSETDPNGAVPPRVREAVLKALEKRPEDRFQTAAEFAEALRAAIPPGEQPVEPRTLQQRSIEERIPTRPADPEAYAVTERSVAASSQLAGMGRGAVEERRAESPPLHAEVTSATAGMSMPRWYPITAIVAIVLIGVAVVLWMKQAPAPVPVPVTNTTVGTTVNVEQPVVETGQLLINAQPWGQVLSVRNTAGVEQLSASAETPVILALPVGGYQVQITNPNSKRTVVRDVVVSSSGVSRCEVVLDKIDPGAYVDGIGIGR